MAEITEIKAALKFYDAPGRRQYLNPKERIALRGLCVEARLPVPVWLRNAKPEHEIENTVEAVLKGEYRFDIGGKSISDRVASILKALPRRLTPDIGEDRNPVARPGSRGGKGYYDDKGKWQYGIKPMAGVKKQEVEGPGRRAKQAQEPVKVGHKADTKLPATISINGTQRSTQNSNGQPIHPTLEGIKKFWEWFGDSKVVDKDGKPLVVYHGTKANFDTFYLTQAGGNNDTGMLGTGFYFSSDKNMSRGYGDKMMQVYLSLKNPYVIRGNTTPFQEEFGKFGPTHGEAGKIASATRRKNLLDAGHDGVIQFDSQQIRWKKSGQIVAFSPTQIKSATGNAGTFDANNPDITKSLSDRVLEILKAGPTGYKLHGRRKWHGLDVSIENRKGSVRTGTDDDGHEWRTKLDFPYGYIRMTDAVDGDHLDCFIGPESKAKKVYVVHQKDPETGEFDEDKCMLDFASRKAAIKAYKSQYDRPGYLQSVTTFTVDKFIEKITNARGGVKKIGEKTLQKSITERVMSIIKGWKYPIGHVSTHKDGTRWRKKE